jgi:pyruvate formate lyase activating enzyme
MKIPLIFEIKGNSLDDGPGIRTVIFFKGCPLSCLWCHNPEGMRPGVELSFDQRECIGCGTCIETCSLQALSGKNKFYVDRQKCNLCFRCVETCPSGALERVGWEMTKAAIVDQVLKDKPFFVTSGGGVTLSGGEPTLAMDFLSGFLQDLKTNGLHCLLETCGLFDPERFKKLIYPHLDAIYFDLKFFDEDLHKQFCGVSNTNILVNFANLLTLAREDGKVLLPRIPLVPSITDTDANLRKIAAFLQSLQVTKTVLLAYNPLWPEKSAKLGYDSTGISQPLKEWLPKEKIHHCEDIFHGYGIEV